MTTGRNESAATAAGARADLAERVAAVVAVIEEEAPKADREALFPDRTLTELRRTGLLGLLVPAEYGGLDGTPRDLVDTTVALGRADMSAAMIFAMHCQQSEALVRYAGPALRARVLPSVADGGIYLASVTTEAGKGGHLFTSRAPLHAEGDWLRVERSAPIVTGGTRADGFLLTMLAPDATADHHVSLVYAHRDQLTVESSGDWDPMGMRASHSVPLRLTGRVPGDQVVGAHRGFHLIGQSVFGPLAHLGWSAAWLGTAAGALSRVVRLLRDPAQRGGFALDSELLLTRISRARQRLDTVHALLRRVETLVTTGGDLSAPSAQLLMNNLKITAAEECHAAVDGLVEAVGLRHGYLRNSPTGLEKALRDLRSASLNYGNDRLHLADGKLCLLDADVTFS